MSGEACSIPSGSSLNFDTGNTKTLHFLVCKARNNIQPSIKARTINIFLTTYKSINYLSDRHKRHEGQTRNPAARHSNLPFTFHPSQTGSPSPPPNPISDYPISCIILHTYSINNQLCKNLFFVFTQEKENSFFEVCTHTQTLKVAVDLCQMGLW